MPMLMLAEFFDQFGIAFCFAVAMIFVAVSIYVWLIKRHSLAATLGFIITLIIGGVVIGAAIRFLV
jgi:hypothetical protein